MEDFLKLLGFIIVFALIVAAVIGLYGSIAMLLWNWIAVKLFGLPVISFWEALGLSLLIQFLTNAGLGFNKKDK